MNMTKTLHLLLKKKWFDMIASGEKKEEYRDIKEYWTKRLEGKSYDQIHFRNGYSKDSRTMLVECKGISVDEGKLNWGGVRGQRCFVIKLGKILEN